MRILADLVPLVPLRAAFLAAFALASWGFATAEDIEESRVEWSSGSERTRAVEESRAKEGQRVRARVVKIDRERGRAKRQRVRSCVPDGLPQRDSPFPDDILRRDGDG